jgi:pimeloyl-ACP methyl ester carboxylesterase
VTEIVEELLDVSGRKVQISRRGSGELFVYLHSSVGDHWMPEFLSELPGDMEIICPAAPGFGESNGLEEIDDIEDLAFHYSDLFTELGVGTFHLSGSSLGGWLAAEIAVRWPERLKTLTLIDSVGIWVDDSPIAPMWGIERDELAGLFFLNQDHPLAELIRSVDLDNPPPDEVLLPFIMQQTATAKIGWDPYLHNPKLASRLHRISCPTMLLWGEVDRLVSVDYGKRFAELIPKSKFETLSGGHLLALEQPQQVGRLISEFIRSLS